MKTAKQMAFEHACGMMSAYKARPRYAQRYFQEAFLAGYRAGVEASKEAAEFTIMFIEHAQHLGYLGEGSTSEMANDALTKLRALLETTDEK